MTVIDARLLERARDDLRHAVGVLTDPARVPREWIELGTGTVIRERAEVASTLDTLEEAVAPSRDGRGGFGRGGGSPLDLAALDLLDMIRVGVADWLQLAGLAEERRELAWVAPRTSRRRESAPARGLRQLRAHAWEDHRLADQLARIVRNWAAQARAILGEPPEYRDVRGVNCPSCGYALWEDVATGESSRPYARVRAWPLRVDLAESGHIRGIWCRVCWATWWRGEGMTDLAVALFHARTYGPIPLSVLTTLEDALGVSAAWTEAAA